jgi:hypothetical protein
MRLGPSIHGRLIEINTVMVLVLVLVLVRMRVCIELEMETCMG